MLHNTCVTNIDKNLISIYRLCYTTGVLAEFFQAYFQVKDIITEVPLLQGKNSNRLYECHVSPCQATIIHGYLIKPINIFFFLWHSQLGHPSLSILNIIVSQFSFPTSYTSQKLSLLGMHD